MEICEPLAFTNQTSIYKEIEKIKRTYYYGKRVIEYIISEKHNDKELLHKYLIKISKTKNIYRLYDGNEKCSYINLITRLLFFYTDELTLDLWYYLVPDAYQLFINNYNYHQITLSSCYLKNLHYLVDRHNASFWSIFNKNRYHNNSAKIYLFYQLDNEAFKNIIKKDNVINYNFTIHEIQISFQRFKDIEVVNIICEQLGLIGKKEEMESKFLEIALVNNHKKIIEYYFENKKDIPIDIIYYVLYPDFQELDLKHEPGTDTKIYYNKFYTVKELSNNLKYVYDKLCEFHGKNEVLDYIMYKYDNELMGNIMLSVIRFHCDFIIKDIEICKGRNNFINYINSNISLIEDMVRYGQYEVVKYIFNNYFDELDINSSCTLIESATFNSDDRVLKIIIEKFKNSQINIYCLPFLSSRKISDKTKIQKLKIIAKNIQLTKEQKNLIFVGIESKTPEFKIIFWIIAKFYNNKIGGDGFPEDSIVIEFLLREIILSKNTKLFDKFIKLCSNDFNYWNIFNIIVKYSSENIINSYNLINKICYKLDDIKNHPEMETNILNSIDFIKFNSGYSYYNNKYQKDENLERNFDSLLKILKQCGFNLNKKCFRYGRYNFLIKIRNPVIFKIAIKNGVSYPEFYRIESQHHIYGNDIILIRQTYGTLYRLIRRLEIRKELKYKKQHKNLFHGTNICLTYRPPSEHVPVLKKGGEDFYKNHRNILADMSWEEDFINPKLITPFELINIAKKEILVTPKIDGVTAKNIDMNQVYPPISREFEDCVFDGEYIKELDIYLVFGLRNAENNMNCPYDDFIELRNEHKVTKHFVDNLIITDSNYDSLESQINKEFEEINKFIKNNQGKTLWWPKAFYKILDNTINLDVLEKLQKIQKVQSLRDESNLIKTDGYIINIPYNKKDVYKLKPMEHMTIDLLYNGKWYDSNRHEYNVLSNQKLQHGVYRCIYSLGKWLSKDYRPEKKHPNSWEIVNTVQEYHNNPWSITELKKYQTPVYYENFESNINLKDFTKLRNIWFRQNINDGMKILDIGCGYLNGYLWNNPNLEIDGIDNDISIKEKFKNLQSIINKKIYIQDFTEKWDFNNDYIKRIFNKGSCDKIYDVILMNFSIHYSFNKPDGFHNLMYEIDKRTQNGHTKLMISFIDSNVMFKEKEQIDFDDGGFLRIIRNNLYDLIDSMSYYYPWRNNSIKTEKVINYLDLQKNLVNYGWQVHKKYTSEYHIHNNGYKELHQAIKRITFIKN